MDERIDLLLAGLLEPDFHVVAQDRITPDDQANQRNAGEGQRADDQFGPDSGALPVALTFDVKLDRCAEQDPAERDHQNEREDGYGPENKGLAGTGRAERIEAEGSLPDQ